MCFEVTFQTKLFGHSGVPSFLLAQKEINPSNAEAFRKPSKPCHVGIHWKTHRDLSNEYPCARVSIIFQGFLYHFVLAKLATTSIRVKKKMKTSYGI